jgi:hypothetical protein
MGDDALGCASPAITTLDRDAPPWEEGERDG